MPSIADLNAKYSNAPAPTRTPPPTPGFFSSVGKGITQGLKNSVTVPYQLAKGIFTGFGNMGREVVASGVRSLQAIPDTVQQIGADIKGDKVAAQEHAAASGAILQAPINGTPTFAGSSVPQNLGSAAQWTSFLVPGTKLGTIAQAGLAGALNQGGAAATDPNATGSSIAQNFIGGGVLGMGTAGAIEGFSNLLDKTPKAQTAPSAIHLPTAGENGVYAKLTPEQYNHLYNESENLKFGQGDNPHLTPLEKLQTSGAKEVSLDEIKAQSPNAKASLEAVPTKPSASRLADATPSYHQVVKNGDITSFVKNPEGEMVPRVNEGKGIFGKESITSNKSEITNARELDNIKNYPDQGTKLEKAQAVKRTISSEAQGTEAKLTAEDEARPLNPKAKEIVTKNVLDNMNRQAREVVMSRGQGIEGDALDRAGSVQGRYAQDVAEELNKYNGTRKGILQLRKNLDTIYEEARGKSAFGDANRNALDEMHTSIRDYLNKEVTESSQSVDVQASLDKQTRLYRAHNVLKNEAEIEARTHYGRIIQKHPALKMTARILSRQGIMVPLHILEALAGVTAVTAAARKVFKK